MNKSSLLPKLLAKENVTVQHGNYKTAWFDLKNRVLGLPLWDDMHKDVYDLFVGHEVGHALETPFEGWHDSPEKLKGCPRTYINVIEDARIERKIQSRYPGLVGSFNRGYEQLLERDFFGDLTDIEWDEIKLIDKINLKTKLGSKLDVPFTSEEKVFLDRSLTTKSFEEVLDLVRDILAWTKENQEELMQKPEPQVDDSSDDDQESESNDNFDSPGHDDGEETESEEQEQQQEQPSDSGEETEEELESGEEPVSVKAAEPVHKDEDISITDTIFREKEKELIDQGEDGKQPIFFNDVNKEIVSKAVIDYKKLKSARETHKASFDDDSWMKKDFETAYTPEEFKQYMKGLKKNVQVAVKEFEMRKAAYQYSRATTAKTGTLDVNKLWSYKTNEDIFLTATNLANAKNHGMMLLVDMSGSMSGSMKQVLDQVMHLVMFCKATNIPFDVYGFTTGNDAFDWDFQKNNEVMEMDGLSMPHICSSSFSKTDFLNSMEHMFFRTKMNGWNALCRYEEWGSTPLNQALVISHHLVKKFKQKHGVEKMNFITFTDGDANRMSVYHKGNDDNRIWPDRYNVAFSIDGSFIKCKNGSRNITKALLGNMKKKYGTNNIGFFMANDNSDWRQRLWILSDELNKYSDEYKAEANKEYRKNKCVSVNNVLGYKEYYLVKGGKNLDTQEDEFSVSDDASNANIRTAFKKFAKSKKLNKVLMTKFGKAVA